MYERGFVAGEIDSSGMCCGVGSSRSFWQACRASSGLGDARHRRRAWAGETAPVIEIHCDEVGAPARLTDLIDNLDAALPAAAADDDMCASAANAMTTARPMLLVAPVTSAVHVLGSCAHRGVLLSSARVATTYPRQQTRIRVAAQLLGGSPKDAIRAESETRCFYRATPRPRDLRFATPALAPLSVFALKRQSRRGCWAARACRRITSFGFVLRGGGSAGLMNA
jgi:hypothetical protein